ncbi:MAG: alpha/beta hydrolase [Actinomycetota bacterium]|nr:alpha/beta hydrolase [Actinomycetota bacterium]
MRAIVAVEFGGHTSGTSDGEQRQEGRQTDPWAVLPRVAAITRVCAYDRPGTTRFGGGLSPSTPVAQPTTAGDGVADLRALLDAAGEPGPYVLVGASWGGMIIKLYASTYPDDVAGLVFVDGASDLLKVTFTPAQWTGWMQMTSAVPEDLEAPDYEPSVQEILAADPAPTVPAVVLTAEVPWDLKVGEGSTWPAWLQAQDRLATELGAKHITDTNSGHPIALEQPQLVIDSIRQVVEEVRSQ